MLAALALLALVAGAQDPEPETDVERYLRVARTGSPVVRPQAAQRLVRLGAPAAERIFAECGDSPAEMARLGMDVIEVLGEFEHAELRAKLWQALDDRDFPWRPSAARTLAKTAVAAEADRIRALAGDNLAAVRSAAVDGFARLGDPERRDVVEGLLDDPHDRVRRSAALLLDRWGDPCALYYVVEDLRRDDRFFESETGKSARYEAILALEKRLGDRHGYAPEKPPAENRAAIDAIAKRVGELCEEAPALPAIARAGGATEGDVLGLEIRSCRRGEFFLRWTADDKLRVGQGNPATVDLPEGTVAALLAAALGAGSELDETFWGAPGCDSEVFYVRPDPAQRSTIYRVSKGPDAVEGLRPDALGRVAAALLASLPETRDDPRLRDLRARVGQALVAVGGELP